MVDVANAFLRLIYRDLLEDTEAEDCSCNCTSNVECTVYCSQDNEILAKQCDCSAKECRGTAQGGAPGASVQVTSAEGQLTLEEIGNETYEDPILSQLRDEILEARTGDIKKSLIRMPRT